MRFVFFCFMVVFLTGCGVSSDSSSGTPSDQTNTDDSNGSTGDSNTTDPVDDLGDPTSDQAYSDFDTRSAVLDPNACIINDIFKNAMEDSSFDPTGTVDEGNGFTISSLLPYDADTQKTIVTIYYPDLGSNLAGSQTTIYKDYYRVSFDQSWPINSQKTIYVRIPRGIESNYYGCMRYTLSLDASSVVEQRVYRVNN